MTVPEHLIEAAIKAATVTTKESSARGLTFIETTTQTQYLDRSRAIAVVEAILKAQSLG